MSIISAINSCGNVLISGVAGSQPIQRVIQPILPSLETESELVLSMRENSPLWAACGLIPSSVRSMVTSGLGERHANNIVDEIPAALLPGIIPELTLIASKMGMNSAQLAAIYVNTLHNWFISDSDTLSPEHLSPLINGVLSRGVNISELVAIAERIWTLMMDPSSPLPLTAEGAIKAWAESGEFLGYDFIIVDGYELMTPILWKLLRRQNVPILAIGDPYMPVSRWEGHTEVPLHIFDEHHRLHRSYEHGSVLTDLASACHSILTGTSLPFDGDPEVNSALGISINPDAYFVYSDTALVSNAMALTEKNTPFCLPDRLMALAPLILGLRDLNDTGHTDEPQLAAFPDFTFFLEAGHSGRLNHQMTLIWEWVVQHQMSISALSDAFIQGANKVGIYLLTARDGRFEQFGEVALGGDFPDVYRNHPDADDLARALYVGIMSARKVLDINRCPPLARIFRHSQAIS